MASTGLPPQSHEDSLTWLSSYTKDPVFNREHDRMHRQHLLVRAAMQNRLIYAPIINSPARFRELDILDSACNDGTWILDVIVHRTAQLRVQEDTKMNFVGTDLDKKALLRSGSEVHSAAECERDLPSPGYKAALARASARQVRLGASATRAAVSRRQRRERAEGRVAHGGPREAWDRVDPACGG
jgi:hypothetical protein